MTATQLNALVKLGWSRRIYDNCWLDCTDSRGHLLTVGQYEICLCVAHAMELVKKSTNGYSQAQPPDNSRASEWPWEPRDGVTVT